jgi:hypothetical protein
MARIPWYVNFKPREGEFTNSVIDSEVGKQRARERPTLRKHAMRFRTAIREGKFRRW